jgi:hypothetical protein
MVKAGLSPMEAIKAGTSNAAALIIIDSNQCDMISVDELDAPSLWRLVGKLAGKDLHMPIDRRRFGASPAIRYIIASLAENVLYPNIAVIFTFNIFLPLVVQALVLDRVIFRIVAAAGQAAFHGAHLRLVQRHARQQELGILAALSSFERRDAANRERCRQAHEKKLFHPRLLWLENWI